MELHMNKIVLKGTIIVPDSDLTAVKEEPLYNKSI